MRPNHRFKPTSSPPAVQKLKPSQFGGYSAGSECDQPFRAERHLPMSLDRKVMDKPPTKKSASDIARELGRAIVSAIPAAGGPLQVAFENIFASPIEKRKVAWLEQLASIVQEVQDKSHPLGFPILARWRRTILCDAGTTSGNADRTDVPSYFSSTWLWSPRVTQQRL